MPEKQQRGGGTWSSQVAARPRWPGRCGPCGHTEGPGPRPRRPRPAPSWPPRGPRSSGKSWAVSPAVARTSACVGLWPRARVTVPCRPCQTGRGLPELGCLPSVSRSGMGGTGRRGAGSWLPQGLQGGQPAGGRSAPGSPGWRLQRGRAPPPCSDSPPYGRLKPTSRRNRNEAAWLTELMPAPLRGRPRPSAQHRSAARTPPAGRAGPPWGIPVLGLLSNLHTLCSEH